MEKIKQISLCFRILVQVLFIALPILLVIAWLLSSGTLVTIGGIINLNYIPAAYANSILHTLSNSEKLLALCVSSIPMFIQLYILYSLINLVSNSLKFTKAKGNIQIIVEKYLNI